MKSVKKYTFVVLISFVAGLVLSRVIHVINEEPVVDYFQDYGSKIIYVNHILDAIENRPAHLREKINKLMLNELFCSPMFPYLPIATEENEKMDTFWEAYFLAFKFAKLTAKPENIEDNHCLEKMDSND